MWSIPLSILAVLIFINSITYVNSQFSVDITTECNVQNSSETCEATSVSLNLPCQWIEANKTCTTFSCGNIFDQESCESYNDQFQCIWIFVPDVLLGYIVGNQDGNLELCCFVFYYLQLYFYFYFVKCRNVFQYGCDL